MALALVVFVIGVSMSGVMAQPAMAQTNTTANVSIHDFYFLPFRMYVSTGTTVEWTNMGTMVHTVTSATGAFNSGNIVPGGTYSHTFTVPGTYLYYCIYHRAIGMYGYVIVTGTGTGGTANLALNRPAVASSSQPGFPASNATDGNTATEWRSAQLPAWMYVDFGRSVIVNRVILRWAAEGSHGPFAIYAYSGFGFWYRVAVGFHGTVADQAVFFRPVVTRYLLLYNFSGTSTTVGLREFEAYGYGFGGVIIPFGGPAQAPSSESLPRDLPVLQ